MKRTIVIIGATGKVGSGTVNLLIGKHNLKLVARHEEKLLPLRDKGAEIFAGDSMDLKFLGSVMKGADAALMMIPADFTAPDIGTYQDKLGMAQIEAIKTSGIKNIVFISSTGGHTEENTGIVAGLARQEKRLRELKDVNILILRPSYFMENLLGNIGIIKSMGVNGSPLEPNVEFPMIAVQDIAKVAAEKLEALDWKGVMVQPLLGPRDYNMAYVTKVLGESIGKPELPYAQFPYDQAKEAMMKQMGLSESVAGSFVELNRGINMRVMNIEERNASSTTPTTIEQFSKTFAYVYNM